MWRLVAVLLVSGILASGASSQEAVDGKIVDLIFKVVSLEFKVIDLGGKAEGLKAQVVDLQVKETATEVRIELPADILFDFDKSDIRPNAAAALKQAADLIRKGAKGTVRIEGHTDGKGKPDYNQKLSARRSMSVQKWLVEREGLKSVKFAIQGFGA